MLAKSHDGTIAPQHVIARHTYADTLDAMRDEYNKLNAMADQSLTDILNELDPVEWETFRVYARRTNGDWRQVYNNPSDMTRLLASRIVSLRNNPVFDQVVILRSKGDPERLAYKHRRFCETIGINPAYLKVTP